MKPKKPWKRALQIVEQCKSGKRLCCFNQPSEENGNEIVYFFRTRRSSCRAQVCRERA